MTPPPALLTRRSSRPNASTASATRACAASNALRSPPWPLTEPAPSSANAVRSAVAASTSATTTFQPSATSRAAMARPMPRPAPVTIAARLTPHPARHARERSSRKRRRSRRRSRHADAPRRERLVARALEAGGVVPARLAQHPAAHVVVLLAAGVEADLAGLERLDVVRGGEAAGAEELEEVVQAGLEARTRLLDRPHRPGVDLHEVRLDGEEGAQRRRHDVVDDEVGVDEHVAVPLGDPLRALGAVALLEVAPDRLDLRPGVLAHLRHPAGDRAPPRRPVL